MRISIFPRTATIEAITVRLEEHDIEQLKRFGTIEYRPIAAPTTTLIYVPKDEIPCIACESHSRIHTCTCVADCQAWDECGALARVEVGGE